MVIMPVSMRARQYYKMSGRCVDVRRSREKRSKMKKGRTFLMTGSIMFLVMCVFLCWVSRHPTATWPVKFLPAKVFYSAYLVIMCACFVVYFIKTIKKMRIILVIGSIMFLIMSILLSWLWGYSGVIWLLCLSYFFVMSVCLILYSVKKMKESKKDKK